MSDARYFSKCKANIIKKELTIHQDNSKKSLKVQKECMKLIIANITMGNNEMMILQPYVINLMSSDDIEIKKMCCHFISSYYYYCPEKYYESKSIFQTDLRHNSSVVRALMIKTIAYIPFQKFQEEVTIPFLKRLLRDPDSYVRRATCLAIGKAYELNPSLVESSGLIEKLNNLLSDPSAAVISSTLAMLDYIVDTTAAMKLLIDESNVTNLLRILPHSNEFYQAYILNSLTSYIPKTSQESLDLIQKVLPYLQHGNTSVVMNTLKLIIYLANYVKGPQDLLPSLSKRIGNSLTSLLSKSDEIRFLVLRNVILLLLATPHLLKLDVTMFFCQYNDPPYINDTKLEIIYLLANQSNFSIVLQELKRCAQDSDSLMAKKSIRAIGNLSVKLESAVEPATEILMGLCKGGIPAIVQEIVGVMKNIYRKYSAMATAEHMQVFVDNMDAIEELDSKSSFLWLVGNYSSLFADPLDILKDFTFKFQDEPLEVQLTLLTSVVKYYLKHPSSGEEILLKLLNLITEKIPDPDLRERAYFYWKLLSSKSTFSQAADEIILAESPPIDADHDKLDPELLEELELAIGSLASVYLKPIKSVFRLANPRKLPQSPALQREYNNLNSDSKASTDSSSPKILRINIKSNVGIIKSPKPNNYCDDSVNTGINELLYSGDKNESAEVDYNQTAVFQRQSFLKSPKNSNRNSVLMSPNRSSMIFGSSASGNTTGESFPDYDANNMPPGGDNQSSSHKFGQMLKKKVRNSILVSPRVVNRNFTA
ncbi:hypothetical protein DASC09_051950 [Saccharomycopsis crataegensis]|uniref:AP complex subunit beta n=1 Tax=Saccharomycopsis crataegensis TaxID=43959 RepID=A0AAV5QSG8_9ASCO|nr:hypothetical protein DASC09_051950 [Saccharomycopsis crataegensis]